MPETARAKKPSIEKLSLEEQIRRRAYELYVLRGNQSGSELDDRLQAEGEIRSAQEEPSTKPRKSLSQPRRHASGNYGLMDQIAALQWVAC